MPAGVSGGDCLFGQYLHGGGRIIKRLISQVVPRADTAGDASTYTLDALAEHMVIGNTLKVVWDGAEYFCEVYDLNGGAAIGNGTLWYGGKSNGEPFLIFDYYVWNLVWEDEDNHKMTVYAVSGEVKKLDERFLPDNVKGRMSSTNPKGSGAFSVNRCYEGEIGEQSVALGNNCVASGRISIALGNGAKATGTHAYAEGTYTEATAINAHAEGECSVASAPNTHAEGLYAIAASKYQHVQGKYNVADTENKYAHIVGNGEGVSDNLRSNAHTLDWEGNAWFAGTVEGTGVIVKSSTEGSSKRFMLTVDDTGAVTATEVT